MGVQGAAAGLSCGNVHLDTVLHQGIYGGAVEMGKSNVVNAASEEGYFAAALADCGKCLANLAEEEFIINCRGEPVQVCNAQQLEQTQFPQGGLCAGTLVHANQLRHETQQSKTTQHLSVEEAS